MVILLSQLEVKDHIKDAQKKKAYDPKKSVWVGAKQKKACYYLIHDRYPTQIRRLAGTLKAYLRRRSSMTPSQQGRNL